MYLRETRRRNTDGSEVAYLALAHNHRDPGPFAAARRRLDAADGLARDDLIWLQQEWADVEEQFRDLRGTLRTGLVHGDAHTGNLLRDRDGQVVLCDLDSTGRGPLGWDLVPTAVGAVRFGRPTATRNSPRPTEATSPSPPDGRCCAESANSPW